LPLVYLMASKGWQLAMSSILFKKRKEKWKKDRNNAYFVQIWLPLQKLEKYLLYD
jgi:hypothetical protein